MKSKKSDRGFTIVELLVTMGILLVMVGISVPIIFSGMSKTVLNRTARDITVELKAARQLAISRNMQFRESFTVGGNDSLKREYRVDTLSAWQHDISRQGIKIDSRVNIVAPAISFFVVFNPNGSATSVDICIENVSNTASRRKVTVHAITGRVEVLDACI